jgi:hypothetical protein
MIRSTLFAAALLLAAPAFAGSFYPTLMGARFCELTGLGIAKEEAMGAAISETWSKNRESVYVTRNGKRTSLDTLDAANYIARNCPEAFK